MVRIEMKDFESLNDLLAGVRRDMPKAVAMTLTWMGQAAKEKVTAKIPSIFDRPNPWTQKSTYLKAATASNPKAEVFIKDNSINSLAHHIEGGRRPAKRVEKLLRQKGVLRGSHQYVVPGKGMKLNQYGNIPMGQMNKILSAMGAQFDKYANTTANSLKRNPNQANYFLVRTRKGASYTRRGKQLHPGIWYGGKGYVKPMLMFVKSTSYSKGRYRFFEIAEDAAYDAMESAAARALARLDR